MSRLPGDGDINMFIIDWTSFGKWAKHVLSSNLQMTKDASVIHIEARVFISYKLLLTRCLYEPCFYLDKYGKLLMVELF